jgi:hypothetical protein
MSNEVAVIDTEKSDRKASESLAYANALVVSSPDLFREADAYCKGLFNLRKEIEADFAESIKKAKEAKAAATAALAALVEQQEGHTRPVQDAERIIKGKLFAFSKAEEDARRKETDRLRAIEQKKAEDEKLRKAEALQAQGKPAAAMAELEKPLKVAPVVLPKAEEKTATKIAEYWSYEVVDPAAVKRDFCKPDPGVIQSSMNAYKKQGKSIAAVEERIGGIRIEAKVK